jgi:hypothetical protein
MVCGEELPAQWQELPLTTRLEIQAGRRVLGTEEIKRGTIARWADEGVHWLYGKFGSNSLMFHTSWDTENKTITLEVYVTSANQGKAKLLFTETCAAEAFVTETMVTKIIMVS